MADSLVANFRAAVDNIHAGLLPIAQDLFILLAAITITWSLIWWILEKDDPVPILVGLLKNLMRIAFFWYVINNSLSLSRIVLNSFKKAGQVAAERATGITNMELSPVGMLRAGSELAEALIANLDFQGLLGSIAGAFIGPILAVLIFIAFLIVAAQIVIGLVEGFVTLAGGVLMLGFLGSPVTARFGLPYFSALVGAGIKILMIYVVVALGGGLIQNWLAAMAGSPIDLGQALTLVGVAGLFSFVAWSIPNYAQGLASGAVNTSLNTLVATGAGLAAAATGLRVPLSLGARASAAIGHGVGIARERYQAGASRLGAIRAGIGYTALSPFRAAGMNLRSKGSSRVSAADVLRAERGLPSPVQLDT